MPTQTENLDHLEAMAANADGNYAWGVDDIAALDWVLAEYRRLHSENSKLKWGRKAGAAA